MPEKFRHTLTKEQRFERALMKLPGEDPVFPVIMHSIERYLAEPTDLSEMDIMLRHHLVGLAVPKTTMKEWVNNWHALPASTKSKFIPEELADLDPERKLDMEIFHSVLKRVSPGLPKPRFNYRVPKSVLKGITKAQIPHSNLRIENITPTDPDGTPWVYLGKQFTVHGRGFDVGQAKVAIVIFTLSPASHPQLGVYPTKIAAGKIEAIAPLEEELHPGRYAVGVFVHGKGMTNVVDVYFGKEPTASAVITGITPEGQFPGKYVLINGNGFNQKPRVFWQAMDPELESGVCYGGEVEYLNKNQLKMTVPDRFVYFAGDYLIAVAGENQPVSNWYPLKVRPFRYKVEFTQIICKDESDPEWWGDDEIVARWAVACDGQTWTKQSAEYEGFSDGTQKAFSDTDKVVFAQNSGAGDVRHGLIVGSLLLEWDEGDVKAWTKVLDYAADACKDGYVGWVGRALKVISKMVAWLAGDADTLGARTLTWSPGDLRDKTNNPSHQFSDTIYFLNDGETGSYGLTYTVTRVED